MTTAPAGFDAAGWYTAAAEAQAEQWHSFPSETLQKFIGLLPAGAVIADVGCGSGRDVAAGQQLGARMIGSDISAGQTQVAAQHASPILQASFTHLPYRTGSVDAVWAFAALIHADTDTASRALREFARITRPGGMLYANVKASERLDGDGYDTSGRWFRLWPLNEFVMAATLAGWHVKSAETVPDLSGRDWVTWSTIIAQVP